MPSILRLGLSALRRDWRSGELHLLLLALVVAVAAVTSVGFLADRVTRALERDSTQMLGADLVVQTRAPIQPEWLERARQMDIQATETVQFPSMVGTDTQSHLVSLKAVSAGYPLRGQVILAPAAEAETTFVARGIPKQGTVWVDRQLLALLGVGVGDPLQVGDLTLIIADIIVSEPDRGLQFVNVSPRVMMNYADLEQAGLLGLGSRASYRLLVAGAERNIAGYQQWLDTVLQRGQEIRTVENSQPEVQRALERAQQFLALVALLTVMVAAVAVALAARRFALRHHDGVAVMRCLGARAAQISGLLWVEFLTLGLCAGLIGSLAGFWVHQGLIAVVAQVMTTALPGPSVMPVFQGLATGVLLLLGFALPPLASLRNVPPVKVLRQSESGVSVRALPAYALGAFVFFALILWVANDLTLGVLIAIGFAVACAVFALIALMLVGGVSVFRKTGVRYAALRFALAGISRRRGLTMTQLCALSTGLTILLLLAITRTDLLLGWQSTVPPDAPNTFLINIQPDQRDAVATLLKNRGIRNVHLEPMVRGRLVTINGVEVQPDDYSDDRARRLVDREFNLSYTSELPDSNRLLQGRWLQQDKPEISLEKGFADTLKLSVGSQIGFDVAGQQVQATVTSVRAVDWDSFQVNFFALFSAMALADAPTTYITSFYIPSDQVSLIQDVVRQFPNITVFDVGAILTQVRGVLDQVIQAVQLLFLFTLAAGVLVLVAALYATRDERRREVAILRALGASGAQLAAALRVELLLLGGLAGIMGTVAATSIAWALAYFVFDIPLVFSWWPWVTGILAGASVALLGGWFALSSVLRTPPLVSLREAV